MKKVNDKPVHCRKSVMLLTKKIALHPSAGRELLCKLNRDVLKDIFGDQVILYELPRARRKGPVSLISVLGGHIDGLCRSTIDGALHVIATKKIGMLFVDGSNLGEVVRATKMRLPVVEVVTFFHNVESRFFWGALRQSKTMRASAVLAANYLSERKAIRYSDKVICLCERDSRLLERIYGRAATHISPISL